MIHRIRSFAVQHPAAFAILFFIAYFIGFFTLEQIITTPQYLIHCRLDDLIPFCEWFIFPYATWFALIPWSLITLLIRDRKNYFYLCGVMFSAMAVSLLLYLLFPNGLALRPAEIEHQNIAAFFVQLTWSVDTPTNVCPSIHVSTTVAIFFAVCRSKMWKHRKLVVGGCGILSILICLATVFLKQHSVIDVLCGFALAVVLHLIVSALSSRTVQIQDEPNEKYLIRVGASK